MLGVCSPVGEEEPCRSRSVRLPTDCVVCPDWRPAQGKENNMPCWKLRYPECSFWWDLPWGTFMPYLWTFFQIGDHEIAVSRGPCCSEGKQGSYELQQAEVASLRSERSQLHGQYVAMAPTRSKGNSHQSLSAAGKQIGSNGRWSSCGSWRWQLRLQNRWGKTISRSNLRPLRWCSFSMSQVCTAANRLNPTSQDLPGPSEMAGSCVARLSRGWL